MSMGGCGDLLGTKTTYVQLAGGGGGMMPVFVVPEENALIAEPVKVSVMATDLEYVQFSVDGSMFYEDQQAPYEWTLNPAGFPDGRHVLMVAASRGGMVYESSGAFSVVAGSAPPVTPPPTTTPEDPVVTDPPVEDPVAAQLVFALPNDGATISGSVTLAVSGDGVESATFRVDGAVVSQDFASPFQWTYDPAGYDNGEHALLIEAVRAGVTESQGVSVIVSKPVEAPVSGDIATNIANLKAGQWYEIPGSSMNSVKPSPTPSGSFGGIMAWSGGAFDTKRDRLIVWGGGHSDYQGNELYGFSMKTFTWTRITEPSTGVGNNGGNSPTTPDGRPMSRHTYDYLEYIPPPIDRFFSGGGAALWYASFSDDITWLFDFDRLEWEHKSDSPVASTGAFCALGPDGKVWQHGCSGDAARLGCYDPATDTWTTYGKSIGYISYRKAAAIDPVHMKFVVIGDGMMRVWDLNRPDDKYITAGQGDTGAHGLEYPGFAWDPVSQRLVAWDGGATVYSLDIGNDYTWTARTTVGVGTTPPGSSHNGTNGRWRYCPSLNVFVVVNSVGGNVYVYRHTDK